MEELTQRKIGVVNALWANSNYDGKEADRPKVITEIEDAYDLAILAVKTGVMPKRQQGEFAEYDESNPFFGKIKVPELDMTGAESRAKTQSWMEDVEIDQR